jgi:hypothetical protein
MATGAITTIIAARTAANDWLSAHLPDRFAAGIPTYDAARTAWQIPIWLAYPYLEPLGPVGELLIGAERGDVRAHTPIAEMKERAWKLYEQRREQIDAPLS